MWYLKTKQSKWNNTVGFQMSKNPNNLKTSFVSFSLLPTQSEQSPTQANFPPSWLEGICSLYLVIQTLFALGFLSVDLHYNV